MAPVRNTLFFFPFGMSSFIYLHSRKNKNTNRRGNQFTTPLHIFPQLSFPTSAPQSTMPFISHIYPNTLCKSTRKLVLTNHLLFPSRSEKKKKKRSPVRTCSSEAGLVETRWLCRFLLSYHWCGLVIKWRDQTQIKEFLWVLYSPTAWNEQR